MDAQNPSISGLLAESSKDTIPKTWKSIHLAHILEEINNTIPAESTTHLTPSVVHGVVPQKDLDHRPQKALRDDYELISTEPGDFVVTMSSYEYGIEYSSIHGGISPDYTVLRPQVDKSQAEFLKFVFKSRPFIEILRTLSTGIRQGKRIYWTDLKNVRVSIPDPNDAEKIISSLQPRSENIDLLINNYELLINKLEKKRELQISHTVEGRDIGSKLVSKGPDWFPKIPQEWEVRKLKYCCDRIVDAINNTAPTTENGFGYMIRTSEIRDGELKLEDADMVDKDTFEEWNRRETPLFGDLVFTREAPVGEACIIPEGEKITLGQRMMLIRPDESTLYNRYLLLWFYSKMAKYQYEVNSHGSTVEHLRVKDVPNLLLPVPPLSVQKRIADDLWMSRDQTSLLIETLNKAITIAKEKKQTLITNAITGQLNFDSDQQPIIENKT